MVTVIAVELWSSDDGFPSKQETFLQTCFSSDWSEVEGE